MKCGKCKFKINIGNTEETGAAFCSRVSSYFPINCKDDCHFLPRKKELYCKDCSRLGRDTACMTARENDKVSNFDKYYYHSAYCKLSSEQEPVSFRAYPHIGMIQDSFTISGDGCLIKLSYLLHPNNIEFYCELTAKMPLFVENIGNEVLYVDTHSGLIKLVPGERKEVKVENVEQEEQSLPSCDLYPAEIIE